MNRYPKAISRPPSAAGKHEGPNTPRYMKAKIKEVPLKEEAIALSWPLVRYADRKKSKHHGPLLYYDAAFDPKDVANVKDNRRVHFLPLPHDDRELPVSTHCKLTEMIIDCPHVGQLIVTNPNGLRCIDVLNAIYLKYQKKPRSGEMPADTTRYMASFAQRCEDCPGLAEFNKKQGFRRIDLLKGKRIFDGLKRSASGHWELMFDAPSPRT
ncbi:hypothetical protein C8J57DRAFT_585423 [Mycena rebaudengoi]|nr:hypothetical protein C8J57DRAFT_585423 [Mycena rebaudengoi]